MKIEITRDDAYAIVYVFDFLKSQNAFSDPSYAMTICDNLKKQLNIAEDEAQLEFDFTDK